MSRTYTWERTCLFCRRSTPGPEVVDSEWTTVASGQEAQCPDCGGRGTQRTGEACVPEGCACEWETCETCDGSGEVGPAEYFRCPSCTAEGRTEFASER